MGKGILTVVIPDKPSWGATTWIWTSEIFSMNVRAQAVVMASQTQNVANAIVQQFFPLFLDNCSFYAFYMFASINFLLVSFVWFFVPEAKRVMLEGMDMLFGGSNHIEKGRDPLKGDDTREPGVQDHGKSGGVRQEDELQQTTKSVAHSLVEQTASGLIEEATN